MAINLYVSPQQGNWKVHYEKESNGSVFSTKEAAITHALSLVKGRKEGEVYPSGYKKLMGLFKVNGRMGKTLTRRKGNASGSIKLRPVVCRLPVTS